jgi:hypothetical protein
MEPGETDRRPAKRVATLAALIIVPVIGGACWYASAWVYLAAGGDFGLGDDTSADNDLAWWAVPVIVMAIVVALGTVIVSVSAIHRWVLADAVRHGP